MRVAVALTGLLASLGFAATAIAAEEPTPITGVKAMTPIAAYKGRLVWSRPDGSGRYELVQRIGNGAVTALKIAHRTVPFDVDLGPTSKGGVLAVYSRCKTEPLPETGLDPEGVQYQYGHHCDIYKFDFSTGKEAAYTKANASDASEFWPTYWKGRLAFGRAYDDKPRNPYVYVKDVESSAPSEQQSGGPRGKPGDKSAPVQLELYGSRLAFQWRYATTAGTGTVFELRVDEIGGKHYLIDQRTVGLTAILVGWPSFENGRVYWSRGCFGDTSGCGGGVSELRRGTYTSPLTFEAAPGPKTLLAQERDSEVTWVLEDSRAEASDWCGSTGTCSIQPLRPGYTAH